MSRDRPLPPDDWALWDRLAQGVEPLSGRHIFGDPPPETAAPDPPAPLPKKMRGRVAAPPTAPPRLSPATRPKPPPPSGGLDGSWDRRIARGRVEPDRSIDLHGLTLDQAWRRLDFGIDDAVLSGARTLLIVTGKAARDPSAGRASAAAVRPRGMIRAKLEDWLSASRHADRIASIRAAHPRHGGAGAVYVILRRTRA